MAGFSAAAGLMASALALSGQLTPVISIGTSSLSGRVIDHITRRPLSEVVVTLTSDDLKHKLSTITSVHARSNERGEFMLAGGYTLVASAESNGSTEAATIAIERTSVRKGHSSCARCSGSG